MLIASVILVLRRFISRRGIPHLLISDDFKTLMLKDFVILKKSCGNLY